MNVVTFLTPNWRLDRAVLPTDTVRPPVSYPIEWGYITAKLRKTRTFVLDEYAEAASLVDTHNQLIQMQSSIIVISTAPSYLFWRCPPLNLDLVTSYVRAARRALPDARVVLIGPHGTTDPNWALLKTGADFAFRGEPDWELAPLLEVGSLDSLVRSPWLAVLDQPSSVAPQADFGTDSVVDYSWCRNSQYQPHVWGKQAAAYVRSFAAGRSALLETSRGCSFDCEYCMRSGFRNRFRIKPIAVVKSEISQIQKLGVAYVFVIDETFGLSWPHAREAIQLLATANLRYGIQTRPDILNADKIELLRSTGCVYAEVGVEANESQVLLTLGKFNDVHAVYGKIRTLQRAIPNVNKNILDLTNVDYRTEVPNRIRSQIDNDGRRPPAFIPYPTTPMGEIAISKYLKPGEHPWEVCEELFIVYSLMSRYAIVDRLLRRHLGLKRIVRCVFHYLKKYFRSPSHMVRTRFEHLYGRTRIRLQRGST
jgi:anaerobic magnesium-protoporphyrin IX monomethyl ester cyclase